MWLIWHHPLQSEQNLNLNNNDKKILIRVLIIDTLFVIGGLALLVYGADRFVEGAASTARGLGVSPLIIGLTIVGIATSAPEVLVGTVAALDGKTNIAIGNAIGSNIANIGLVLGATALFCPLVVASKTLRGEYLIMLGASLIALILLLDQKLDRIDGIILLSGLFAILCWIVIMAKRTPTTDPLIDEFEQELPPVYSVGKSLLLMLFGLVLLLAGAELLVRGAVNIARFIGVSDLVIGLSIIAIGTSLPELAASIMSVIKKEADIAIGNVIGSNMFNMLMVLGVPCLIHPGTFGTEVLFRDFAVMIFLSLIMGWMVFVHGKGKFDRVEGAFLFCCFVGYQSWLFISATA